MSANADSGTVGRPPVALYEVRTNKATAYRAEGDIVEHKDGWFILWANDMVMALMIPLADITAVRCITEDELHAELPVDQLRAAMETIREAARHLCACCLDNRAYHIAIAEAVGEDPDRFKPLTEQSGWDDDA